MAHGVQTDNSFAASQAPVRSAFADDPDFAELVEFFVESMPERQDAMRTSFGAGDYDSLRVTAHQLKGAGGGYGFDGVSERAALLEQLCSEGGPQEIMAAMQDLLNYLDRVQA